MADRKAASSRKSARVGRRYSRSDSEWSCAETAARFRSSDKLDHCTAMEHLTLDGAPLECGTLA